MIIDDITVAPFCVPLREPFTISRASVDSTRAVAVRARLSSDGHVFAGYGEAALPLGSPAQPEALASMLREAGAALVGRDIAGVDAAAGLADEQLGEAPVARSALHAALVDAFGRATGVPVHALFGGAGPVPMLTDVTLPIADPNRLAELATGYFRAGFRSFKIKVGADVEADIRTVRSVARVTPTAALRFDANEGYSATEALRLLSATREIGLDVECFEQPCARLDLAGMREVRETGGVPVVADEAVRSEADVDRLVEAGAIDGVNLKLVKMGGIDRCIAVGRHAQALGLELMVGAMIESRLGLTAMAHVVAVLERVAWVDLDTAFLLAGDPVVGGMLTHGPELSLSLGPGLDLEIDDAFAHGFASA